MNSTIMISAVLAASLLSVGVEARGRSASDGQSISSTVYIPPTVPAAIPSPDPGRSLSSLSSQVAIKVSSAASEVSAVDSDQVEGGRSHEQGSALEPKGLDGPPVSLRQPFKQPLIEGASFYGQGTAGTLGVPNLAVSGKSGSGQKIRIYVQNSSGVASGGWLLVGTSQTDQHLENGGVILCSSDLLLTRLQLAVGTNSVSYTLPSTIDVAAVCIQVIQSDPGAAGGLSMTRGLRVAL